MSHVKRQLKALRSIDPGAAWKQEQWERLAARLPEQDVVSLSFWQKSVRLMQHPSVFKPLGNIAMVALVVFIGSWSAVASAQKSLPGNMLYTVKLGLQRVELALTVDNNAKVTKQTNIAKQRVEELNTIATTAKTGGLPVVTNDVDRTVKDIRRNLEDAKSKLSSLQAKGKNGELVATAAEVEREVTQIGKSLQQVAASLPAEVRLSVSQEIEQVTDTITDTSDQALGVIITDGLGDAAVSEDEVIDRLHNKMAIVQSEYDVIDVATWQEQVEGDEASDVAPETVDAVLGLYDHIGAQWEVMETRIEEKNYLGALTLTTQVREQIKTLQALMENPTVLGEQEEVVEEETVGDPEVEVDESTDVEVDAEAETEQNIQIDLGDDESQQTAESTDSVSLGL